MGGSGERLGRNVSILDCQVVLFIDPNPKEILRDHSPEVWETTRKAEGEGPSDPLVGEADDDALVAAAARIAGEVRETTNPLMFVQLSFP